MTTSAIGSFGPRQVWNVASYGLIGVFGVALNVVVVRWCGASGLGVFNVCLSLQVVLGQFFNGGMHYATLQRVPRLQLADGSGARDFVGMAVSRGILLSLLLGGASLGVLLFIRKTGSLSEYFPSLYWLLGSLLFFSANKTMIFALNATHRYARFAVVNSIRVALVLFGAVFFWIIDCGVDFVFAPVLFAEFILFFALFTAERPKLFKRNVSGDEAREALKFGMKASLSGIVQEANTRVDVLCLATLSSPSVVGVYSFVSMLAEGVFQLAITFRNSLDPIISACSNDTDSKDFSSLSKKVKLRAFWVVASFSVLLIAGYILVFPYFVDRQFVSQSLTPLLILLVGTVAISPYIPFGAFLQQCGHPVLQFRLMLTCLACNVVGNLALIPAVGMVGASLATVFSYAVFVVVLRNLAMSKFAFRI